MLLPVSTLAKPKEMLRYNYPIYLVITRETEISNWGRKPAHLYDIVLFWEVRKVRKKLSVISKLFGTNLLVETTERQSCWKYINLVITRWSNHLQTKASNKFHASNLSPGCGSMVCRNSTRHHSSLGPCAGCNGSALEKNFVNLSPYPGFFCFPLCALYLVCKDWFNFLPNPNGPKWTSGFEKSFVFATIKRSHSGGK